MPTLYTAKLRLALPTTGELFGLWGATVNNNITTMLEEAIAGRKIVTHNDAPVYTLTANNGVTDESRAAVLRIEGALTAARAVVCPAQPKIFIVENATTGGFAITFKTAAGTGITVAAGKSAQVRCDGTNVIPIDSGSNASSIGGVNIINTPTTGDTLVAIDASNAAWQVLGGDVAYRNTNNVYNGSQTVAEVALTPGASVPVDASLSNNFTLTANQDYTLENPTNLVGGMILNFRLKQPNGAPVVIAWGDKYIFPNGAPGVLTAESKAVDFVSCYYNAGDDNMVCVINYNFLKPASAGTVKFYDQFIGTAASNLTGHTPDITTGGLAWVSSPTSMLLDGSAGGRAYGKGSADAATGAGDNYIGNLSGSTNYGISGNFLITLVVRVGTSNAVSAGGYGAVGVDGYLVVNGAQLPWGIRGNEAAGVWRLTAPGLTFVDAPTPTINTDYTVTIDVSGTTMVVTGFGVSITYTFTPINATGFNYLSFGVASRTGGGMMIDTVTILDRA